jgi:hypothetical protein
MSFCSISNTSRTKFSCFSGEQLQKIARAYNQNNTDKIKLNQPIEQLWRELRERLSNLCSTEYCWLDVPYIKQLNDPSLERSFSPRGPVSPRTMRRQQQAGQFGRNNMQLSSGDAADKWLSTDNIDQAMERFEEIYQDFTFFGPVPIDFAEIVTELNNLNLKRLYQKGTRRIGIVFNFDPHYKAGSHWVALMIDLSSGTPNSQKIAFFDSYGNCPPRKEIQDLINSIRQKARDDLGMELEVLCNKTRHQFSSSECGVYSIYFLEKSLEGTPFMQIFSNIIGDEEINQRRARYFRPEDF